jgi:hypothetical protein
MKAFARPAHLPAFVQLDAPVWYESMPGHIYAAVVVTEPRQLGDGEWVVKVRLLEPGELSKPMPIVTVDALAPRRAGSTTVVHEFIAVFFSVDHTTEAA